MSLFSGLEFYVYLVVLLIPAIILGFSQISLRWYRNVVTLTFIFLVYKDNLKQTIFLVFYCILAVLVVTKYQSLREKHGREKKSYYISLTLVILPLIISKIAGLYGHNLFGFLGLSYIFFKVVQIIIEIYDGVIKETSISDLLSFILFFPTLSSGPIDRSRRYLEDDKKVYSKLEYGELFGTGLYKIMLGLVYKLVLSRWFFYKMGVDQLQAKTPVNLVLYAYIYGLYLFFDFAGYSNLAIGSSYILGIKTPENFKLPFISVDLKDFWSRWHISLSTWFRDFVFTRIFINLKRKRIFSDSLKRAATAYILNMGIMGVWHGLEANYIVYGLYHGILLALTEVYQKSKFYKKYKNNKIHQILSWILTINLVMLGFLIFSGHLNKG